MLWEHDDWVRFPAARLNEAKEDSWESKGAPVELPGFLRSGRMSEQKGFPAARLNDANTSSCRLVLCRMRMRLLKHLNNFPPGGFSGNDTYAGDGNLEIFGDLAQYGFVCPTLLRSCLYAHVYDITRHLYKILTESYMNGIFHRVHGD